jgi:hypothetical protein
MGTILNLIPRITEEHTAYQTTPVFTFYISTEKFVSENAEP